MTSANILKDNSAQPQSLTHFLHQQQAQHQICPNLCRLIEHMAAHCQQIGQRVRQGSLGGILGSTEQENVQGEIQQKLEIGRASCREREWIEAVYVSVSVRT